MSGVRQFGLAEGVVDIAYSGGSIDDIRQQIEDRARRSSRAMSSLRNLPWLERCACWPGATHRG
jgi:hypothetical protein